MDGGRVLKRADPSTIQDKFLVGYQGWFTCAGDGEPIDPGHHGWLHWFNHPIPDGGRPMIDVWPNVSEYSSTELYEAPGVKFDNGESATLFSSRNPKSVQRHFNWMARHGIDGVFLQRFLGVCDPEHKSKGIRRLRDEIGDRVREAAEKEGRVFAIMYDVSGVDPARVMSILTRDWNHLIHRGILESPNYLKERGKPVVALWGFGFHERDHTPELVREATCFIRDATPGGAAYLIAGTPTHWRRAVEDADRNPAFLDVWLNNFDALSPWMVGRLRDEEAVDRFAEQFMKADIELLKKSHEEGKRKIDYIPVVFPGFSGKNLNPNEWELNQIKRNGGRLLWQQIFNAKRLGLRIMYGAMWDEYDEGTALMPVVEKTRLLPHAGNYPLLALDADGYDLPADWYMRICGFAAEGLRSERMIHETFPSKELQDYWSTRPRYEEVKPTSGNLESETASGSEDAQQSYTEWLASQKDSKDEPPPPPYSFEAEEAAPSTSSHVQMPASSPQSQQPLPGGSVDSSLNRPAPTPVASLASDFSRQSISSPAVSNATTSGSTSISRPPLHPSHPGRTSSGSSGVGSSSSTSPPPTLPSRPRPADPSHVPQTIPVTRPQAQTPVGNQPPSSSPQWPPAEWNSAAGGSRPSSVPYQTYHPGRPQANPSTRPTTTPPRPPYGVQIPSNSSLQEPLSRPQSNASSTSLRPTTTYPRPTSPYDPQSTGASYFSQAPAPSSYASPLGIPSFPPGPYGPAAVQQSHHSYSPPPSSSPSFPAGSYGPTTAHRPEVPYGSRPSLPSQNPPGSSYPGMTLPHSPPSQGGFPDAYYGSPLHHHQQHGAGAYGPPPTQPYQTPGYPPAESPYAQEASGPWAPPQFPARPVNSPYNQPPQGNNAPYPQQMPQPGSTSSSLTKYARSAVDRVAGQDTRQQLENTLGSLAQSGSKLLGKFK
ncbi:hypothetical protein D9757_001418 [Collybiopsis confluens]|uniref:Xylosidase/arabinosidase n=1 Tax=Collybiopsis confluens TaxID=2823264 RepID=A0A8H5HZ11_9AGAR|nr:hypothetical protein D9757_001418 [Collybiopsis confluens]